MDSIHIVNLNITASRFSEAHRRCFESECIYVYLPGSSVTVLMHEHAQIDVNVCVFVCQCEASGKNQIRTEHRHCVKGDVQSRLAFKMFLLIARR